ncbi:MAG TPA: glycosyltransferase family 2 protein [Proteobacteria bacterium]|nr:glycosyltransferase family 2 protein [Pseudomonadota bacterium]
MSETPLLTVVVVFFNMPREAARTLWTLSPDYQREVAAEDYRVVVIDHGSSRPLGADFVAGFGKNFVYRFHETKAVSPVQALNQAVAESFSELVMVMIDGAHMLSPGVIANALRAARAWTEPFVTVVGFHLGRENQNRSVSHGYDQVAEDALLNRVAWRENGYLLFELAGELAYDCAGWFGPLAESNCFMMKKTSYERLGGFDSRFTEAGGGLAILDFFRRALLAEELDYIVLLGEGSFHQFHGGVASNAPYAEHPWERFHRQYRDIRGEAYRVVARRPHLLGRINPEVDAWTRLCARVGLEWWLAETQHPHDLENFFCPIGYAMLAAKTDPREARRSAQLEREIVDLKQLNDQLSLQAKLAGEKTAAKVKLLPRAWSALSGIINRKRRL